MTIEQRQTSPHMDRTGRRYGDLVVLGLHSRSKYGELIWECLRDDGVTKYRRSYVLTGKAKKLENWAKQLGVDIGKASDPEPIESRVSADDLNKLPTELRALLGIGAGASVRGSGGTPGTIRSGRNVATHRQDKGRQRQ